jgi:monoamine oxidase
MAQHPDKNILVVGEMISRKQGWTEGALESVEKVVTPEWIDN